MQFITGIMYRTHALKTGILRESRYLEISLNCLLNHQVESTEVMKTEQLII